MVEVAGAYLGAAIAGTRGAIPSVTGEGSVTRAGRPAMASQPAVLVIVAFKRKRALVRAIAMDIDLPADGGFVFANGLGDSGLGRAVMNAGLDDLAFIKGDMKIFIRRSHKRYLRSK